MSTSSRPAVVLAAMVLGLLISCAFAAQGSSKQHKPFGLIFGTAYGPDQQPMYGARVKIHPVGKKHPSWDLISDHRGEFAQRVPAGPSDYVITGEAEIAPVIDGKPQLSRKKRVKALRTVHVQSNEEQDISLHLRE